MRPNFWRHSFAAWAIFAALGAAWSLATPIGASPDEPAHLIRAASVATGQIAPFATNGKVHVPEWVWYSQKVDCFALGGDTTPGCVAPDPTSQTRQVTVFASSGRYDPLYYAAVGWPSLLFNSNAGIYAMRVVSDVVVTFFLGLSVALILDWRRRVLALIGLATAATPMVVFLSGVVNPNSLEITATLAAFVGMVSIIREPAPDALPRRAAIVFAAAAVAANMRGLSLLWIAVALLAPLVLVSRVQLLELLRAHAIRRLIIGCAIAFGVALTWLLIAKPLGGSEPGAAGTFDPQALGTSHTLGFLWTLFSTFYYGQQIVGQFGWLETPSPAFVYFVWSALIGGIVIGAFALLRRRALLFAAVLVASLLLLPALVQGIYVTSGGVVWQGRYILPVFVCAIVGLTTVLTDRITLSDRTGVRLLAIAMGAVALAQFLAFATTLKRFAVGMSPQWPAMLHPLWSPPGGVVVLIAAFGVLSTGAAVALVLVSRRQLDDLSTGSTRIRDETYR